VQVTHAIATKRGNFTPARRFEGQEVIAKAGTVLGHDDGEPVTTPYDDCVLVMPAVNRPLRAGVTVVRWVVAEPGCGATRSAFRGAQDSQHRAQRCVDAS
jgi:hypothetical protein